QAADLTVQAADLTVQAADLTAQAAVTTSDGNAKLLTDGNYTTRVRYSDGGTVHITTDAPAHALSLIWDVPPAAWQLTTPHDSVSMGQEGYLHQFAALPGGLTDFSLVFDGKATLCELRLLGAGAPPPQVQRWLPPAAKADLLLLPTHADDEHLYFGGAMPVYTDRGKTVQVAYLVNHNGEPYRPHELLNGLWTVGVRHYPVIPSFPDRYSGSLEHAKTIYDPQAVLDYQIALIRRFRPEVIVGHDIHGEYGHGAHRLNAATLQQSVVAAADPSLVTDQPAWDTKKTYLHLWPEHSVTMDWSQPLDSFGGKTGLQAATDGFACHRSQQQYFTVEAGGPYDCRKFGLYRTTVGPDVAKNDLFEHVPPGASWGTSPDQLKKLGKDILNLWTLLSFYRH
ncbi:MAG: PIG-L family deacetylase, partial [Angelakisella sp.]